MYNIKLTENKHHLMIVSSKMFVYEPWMIKASMKLIPGHLK